MILGLDIVLSNRGRRMSDGYGLGLATVRRLCAASGFETSITSVHRPTDDDGWGLFTVSIFIPKDKYSA